mmetsp:Transcript_29858/g.65126  ORF Transcript_29858/g.65126 Transcript_29858/m.65126 type:complete len:216 (+) Transcript_29858:136-783(+)
MAGNLAGELQRLFWQRSSLCFRGCPRCDARTCWQGVSQKPSGVGLRPGLSPRGKLPAVVPASRGRGAAVLKPTGGQMRNLLSQRRTLRASRADLRMKRDQATSWPCRTRPPAARRGLVQRELPQSPRLLWMTTARRKASTWRPRGRRMRRSFLRRRTTYRRMEPWTAAETRGMSSKGCRNGPCKASSGIRLLSTSTVSACGRDRSSIWLPPWTFS